MEKHTVSSVVDDSLFNWLQEYASERKWSMSQTIAELLTEKRKDEQCRELAHAGDGRREGETIQDFVERLRVKGEKRQERVP